MANDPAQQDDHEWLDALAGKRGSGSVDSGQGARLRRALQEIEQDEAAQEDMAHDWERLRFAIRREQSSRKSGVRIGYFALAASVLIVLGSLRTMMPTQESVPYLDEVSTMRGNAEQVVMSADPKQEADQLEAELRRLNIEMKRQDEVGRIRLEIALPQSGVVRALLDARAIRAPKQGALVIVFMPRP